MLTKVHINKAVVFPVVMYGYESWAIKKLSAEESMLSNCGAREDSRVPWTSRRSNQSVLRKSTLNTRWKDWCWSWSSNTLAPDTKRQLIGKDPDAGKDWGQEEKGVTEDETVGWHHWLNGREFMQTQGDSEGQGTLVGCSSWVSKSQIWLSDWTTTLFPQSHRLNSALIPLGSEDSGLHSDSFDSQLPSLQTMSSVGAESPSPPPGWLWQ